MSTFTVARVWNALPDVIQVTALVGMCLVVLAFPILFLVGLFASFRPALRAGKNSIYMSILGRHCMTVLSYFMALGASNPAATDKRMDREAREKYAIVDRDPVARRGGGVCLYGSSTFTYWTRASHNLGMSQVFNSAFGGSKTYNLLPHMEELVLKHRPAVVVYYCGTNDISAGANAEDTAAGFAEFVRRARKKDPELCFIYLCPVLSPIHIYRGKREIVLETGRIVREWVEKSPVVAQNVEVVDINDTEWARSQSDAIFLADGLHFTREGHRRLGETLGSTVRRVWKSAKQRQREKMAQATQM